VPRPNALPDAALTRFASDLGRIMQGCVPDRIGLAVSGGPDSLALLLLANGAYPGRVQAATIDHALRAASADEARFVGEVCASLGVPHQIFTLDASQRDRGNVSNWARDQRYTALAGWVEAERIDLLLTAHHADDQLETVIMRLNRGSGVAGLSGVRARRGNVARPLLGWRKSELEALVRDAGLTPVDDPSNHDDRFDRARLRKALAGADWLDPVAVARSAEALAQAEEALDWTARAYAGRRIGEAGGVVSLSADGLPHELRRRLVMIAMRQIVPDCAPRGDELERLIRALEEGKTATLAGVKCSGGTFWLFSKAPPHRQSDRNPASG
jgi:tRNA(Ile)-lysidine synthase